ncbi:MAG: hypothetical protein ACLR8Y_13805 [Alistipes indistinctus]
MLLGQQYHQYEVVVVDCSYDEEIGLLLNEAAAIYPHLRLTRINAQPNYEHSIKLAITVGIKAAAYEHSGLHDGGQLPDLGAMALADGQRIYRGNVVIGYCGIEIRKGFANRMIRLQPARHFGTLPRSGDPRSCLPRHFAQHRLHQEPLLCTQGFQPPEHEHRRRRPVHPDDRHTDECQHHHESPRHRTPDAIRRIGLVARDAQDAHLCIPLLSARGIRTSISFELWSRIALFLTAIASNYSCFRPGGRSFRHSFCCYAC